MFITGRRRSYAGITYYDDYKIEIGIGHEVMRTLSGGGVLLHEIGHVLDCYRGISF